MIILAHELVKTDAMCNLSQGIREKGRAESETGFIFEQLTIRNLHLKQETKHDIV